MWRISLSLLTKVSVEKWEIFIWISLIDNEQEIFWYCIGKREHCLSIERETDDAVLGTVTEVDVSEYRNRAFIVIERKVQIMGPLKVNG